MNSKTLIWGLGGLAGVVLIVAVVFMVSQTQNAPTPSPAPQTGSTGEDAANANAGTGAEEGEASAEPEAADAATREAEESDPPPARESIRLVARYLRPAVEEGQHYVAVESVSAGPTPCRSEGLLLALESDGMSLAWEAEDRLEITGAYVEADGFCRVVLDEATHTLRTLPRPEPEPEPETQVEAVPEEPAEERVQPEPVRSVRLEVTVSTIRDGTAYLLVDRALEGNVPCAQVSMPAANLSVEAGARYEVTGRFDPAGEVACQLWLANPLTDLQLLTPAPPSEPAGGTEAGRAVSGATPTVGVPMPSGAGGGFFVSGGVSYLDPVPLFQGSAGFAITPEVRGMLTAGMGSGELELTLPSGEPISAEVSAILIEAAGLYRISGPLYAGVSGGLLMLSGQYDLPFPVAGSTRFSESIPLVGAVVGYDLGMAMVTFGVGIALGG